MEGLINDPSADYVAACPLRVVASGWDVGRLVVAVVARYWCPVYLLALSCMDDDVCRDGSSRATPDGFMLAGDLMYWSFRCREVRTAGRGAPWPNLLGGNDSGGSEAGVYGRVGN